MVRKYGLALCAIVAAALSSAVTVKWSVDQEIAADWQNFYFVYSQQNAEAMVAGWSQSWLVFAGYALVVAVTFAFVFRYKHNPETIGKVSH